MTGPPPLCGEMLGMTALPCAISSPPSSMEEGMRAFPHKEQRRCEMLLISVPGHAGNL